MRFLKFLAVTLVVALGFSSCKPDNGDDHNHTSDLAGIWTCLTENYAEALIINADGTAVSYGVENGEYWENVKGTVVTNGDNNITMNFDDDDNLTGHFDIIPGVSFSLFEDSGEHYVYQYCENDLADEIIGMWVCNDGLTDGITIMSYFNNGKSNITTANAMNTTNPLVNQESDYVVVGDLVFTALPTTDVVKSQPKYTAAYMTYTPNGTSVGDIMTHKMYIPSSDGVNESVMSFLRIKQNLELPGMKYDYMKTFISNVNGKDMDVPFFNTTINFANFDSSIFNMFLKSTLFGVQFPNANTIEYSFLLDEQITPMQAPIMVEGNKMTIKMSEVNSVYRDVEVYTFQDQDNTQMHMYMHTSTFVNFFGNMQINLMAAQGQLDMNDTAAVNAIFDSVDEAVESINLSLVMSKSN